VCEGWAARDSPKTASWATETRYASATTHALLAWVAAASRSREPQREDVATGGVREVRLPSIGSTAVASRAGRPVFQPSSTALLMEVPHAIARIVPARSCSYHAVLAFPPGHLR
jgi:hypothetical protein